MTPVPSTTGAIGGTTASATTPDAARLHKASQSFEAIFTRQMLAAAHQTNFGDTLWGDDKGDDKGEDTFKTMRDERFAVIAAQSGALGLGKQIEAQLSAHLPIVLAATPGSKG